jgi:WD40 repeat protein
MDRDLIAERLQKDTREQKGIKFSKVADGYENFEFDFVGFKSKSAHQKPLTSICYSSAGFIYTGSKDSIAKWDMEGKKLHVFTNGKKKTKRIERRKLYKETDGHHGDILCLDASSDGKFMVSSRSCFFNYQIGSV